MARTAAPLLTAGVLVCWCVGAEAPAIAPAPQASAAPAPFDLRQPSPLVCGRHSLYMLLRLHGHPVSYPQLEETLPLGPRGTSMFQLRDAAGRFGMKTEVRKRTLTELRDGPLPVLAHFKMSPYVPASEETPTGHFVVVVAVNEDGVEVLDGSFGRAVRYKTERFESYWSGHVLVPTPTESWSWEPWAAAAGMGLSASVGLWWWRARAEHTGANAPNEPSVSWAASCASRDDCNP